MDDRDSGDEVRAEYGELDKLTLDLWKDDNQGLPSPERRVSLFHHALTKITDEPYAMRRREKDSSWYLHPTSGTMSEDELEYLSLISMGLCKRLKSLDRVEGIGSRLPDVNRKQLGEMATVLLTWSLFRPDE